MRRDELGVPEDRCFQRVHRPVKIAAPLIDSPHQQMRFVILRRDRQELAKRGQRVLVSSGKEGIARRLQQLVYLWGQAANLCLRVQTLVLISFVAIVIDLAEGGLYPRNRGHTLSLPLGEGRK